MLSPSVSDILRETNGISHVTIAFINGNGPVAFTGPDNTVNITQYYNQRIQTISQCDPLLADLLQKMLTLPEARQHAENLSESISGFAQESGNKKMGWFQKIIEGAKKLNDIKETIDSTQNLATQFLTQLQVFVASNGFQIPFM